MAPDLTNPAPNPDAHTAQALLLDAAEVLNTNEAQEVRAAMATAMATMAQAHATLALARETRAAAYDTRTAAYVAYLATLGAGTHADAQHAAVVDALIRDRLNFTPTEGDTSP